MSHLAGSAAGRICVCTAKELFEGIEPHVKILFDKLMEMGHEVELVEVPSCSQVSFCGLNEAMSWRLLDLEKSCKKKPDLVIACRFPSCAVKHRNKVIWLSDIQEAKSDCKETTELFNQVFKRSLLESRKVYAASPSAADTIKSATGCEAECLMPPQIFDNDAWDKVVWHLTSTMP